MRPPPFMLGTALLFWGWRTDMLWAGAIAGGLLELSNTVRSRWDFTDTEFNRLWDICTLLFLAAAVYLRFSEDVTSAAYKFFQWMPLIFFPMALGFVFSPRETVPLRAFSWFLRRKDTEGGDRPVAAGWMYFAVCLITAGATNVRDIWFYIGLSVLTGAALFVLRPRRLAVPVWCALFLVCAGAGFVGQARLPEVQTYFENKVSEFFVRFGGRREFDPERSRTAMGRIGALKQSSRIVMKVKAEYGPLPEHLRQSTFSKLDRTVWRGSGRSFEHVPVEPDGTTWTLLPDTNHHAAVRIIQRAEKKNALLAVPVGTVQLRDLASTSLQTNRYQVVLAEGNPGLLNFSAWTGDLQADPPPWDWDREIPEDEDEAISAIAREMAIDSLPPERKIPAIINYFQRHFTYTTFQKSRALGLHNATPLSDFLLRTRAGHCEYFGSATVLLLRHFGIPSRYVTGYSVQELASDGKTWIIRERHGHAWALAWIHDKWIEVDSTPPSWESEEESEFPAYEGLKDAWERLTFGFLEWRWLGDWAFFRLLAPWLVVPLMVFLAWRIFGRRMKHIVAPRESQAWPGEDSEFFALEKRLAKAGLARENHESTAAWLARVQRDSRLDPALMEAVLRLHYRYRFDPAGISSNDREHLREMVRGCLAELR